MNLNELIHTLIRLEQLSPFASVVIEKYDLPGQVHLLRGARVEKLKIQIGNTVEEKTVIVLK